MRDIIVNMTPIAAPSNIVTWYPNAGRTVRFATTATI